jgi:hypothetical protein
MGKTKDLSAFEQGMAQQFVSRTAKVLGLSRSKVSCVYQE